MHEQDVPAVPPETGGPLEVRTKDGKFRARYRTVRQAEEALDILENELGRPCTVDLSGRGATSDNSCYV